MKTTTEVSIIIEMKREILSIINTRANIVAFRAMIERYRPNYCNGNAKLYNQAVYVVTLDRLMDTYEKETK